MSSPAARPSFAAPDPQQQAHRVTESVIRAWHTSFGGSRVEVPISVVAALSLLPETHVTGLALPDVLTKIDRGLFVDLLRRVVLEFSVLRPDLRPRTMPLWSWLDDDPDEHLQRAAHTTGVAAVRAGLLDLTGHPDRRVACDVLGSVLQAIRSKPQLDRLGQFLTPLPVTQLTGNIVAAELGVDAVTSSRPEGQEPLRVLDPCVGTGAMLLGAAQAFRARGMDPTRIEWWANDIDWLAAACTAVNVHLWGLGLRVVVGCGDGLLDEWMRDALTQRQAAIDELTELWKTARSFVALRVVLGLGPPKDPFMARLQKMRPPPPKAAPPHSATFDPDAQFRQVSLFKPTTW